MKRRATIATALAVTAASAFLVLAPIVPFAGHGQTYFVSATFRLFYVGGFYYPCWGYHVIDGRGAWTMTCLTSFTPPSVQNQGLATLKPTTFNSTQTRVAVWSIDAQLVNRTLVVRQGVPTSIVFNVTHAQARTYRWDVTSNGDQLAFLNPFFNVTTAQLPPGVTVQYPHGMTFSGNQSALTAVLTFSGQQNNKTEVNLWLQISDPVQGVSMSMPFNVTVLTTSSPGWSPLILAMAVVAFAIGSAATALLLLKKRDRPQGDAPEPEPRGAPTAGVSSKRARSRLSPERDPESSISGNKVENRLETARGG